MSDGWYIPRRSNTNRLHFFKEGRSLCRKFNQTRETLDYEDTDTRCSECAKNFLGSGNLTPVKVEKMSRFELEKLRDIKKVDKWTI